MFCNKCGQQLPTDAQFCFKCGNMINGLIPKKPKIEICPFCKEEITEGSTKCKHCGSLLIEQKEVEEVDRAINNSSNTIYATYTIIGINVLVFILMLFDGAGLLDSNTLVHIKWGSNYSPLTLSGDWWRLITNIFIHFGIIHITMNMYCLYSVGVYLEPILGKVKYIAAYLCTGILASITSLWWHSEGVNSAGASGAIFGMYGLFLALLTTTNLIPKKIRRALLQSTVIFVVYNLVYGIKSGVDNAAHIGGLLSGFILGYLYVINHLTRRKTLDQKHSDRGIMSLIIWGVTFLFVILWKIALIDMLQRSLADQDGMYIVDQFNTRVAVIAIVCAIINAAGLAFGISGMTQANRKRHFSAFGVALNGVGVLIALSLISQFIGGGLILLTVIATGIWVFFDAERIGVRKTDEKAFTINMGPIGWALCSWLLWVIAFPIYLIKRPEFQQKFQREKQFQTPGMQPSALCVTPVSKADDQDIDQQLRKLAKLKNEGIISPEEFDQKKKSLLGL